MSWAWLRHPIMAVVAVVVAVAGMGNFFWFASEYGNLGGAASGGYVQDGRYFVGNRGDYHEVTREAWEFSQLHEASLIVSHPLAMLATGFLMFGWLFPFGMGRVRPDTAARVTQLRESGPPLASAMVSGRIGWLGLRGPFLRVSVYPDGIVFQPLLMPSRAILASELVAVEAEPPGFGGLRAARVELRHTSPDLRAKVVLYIGERDQLTAALRSLLPG